MIVVEMEPLNSNTIWSLAVGFVVMVLFYMAYKVIANDPWLKQLVIGADNRASSSKLQWTIWTIVVLYAFITIYIARVINGHWEPIQEMPQNVLIAMGFSITTMAAAKAITTEYVANGSVNKGIAASRGSFLGSIFKDEDDKPDLSKVQMMAWTTIAIMTYLLTIVSIVTTKEVEIGRFSELVNLPDIPAALMVLMGLGQGAYLGKKLVTKDTPRITGLSPGNGKADTEITLSGESFGALQNGSLITINGNPITVTIPAENWTDKQIKFKLPLTQPNGDYWNNVNLIKFGLIVNGRASENDVPFTILKQQ